MLMFSGNDNRVHSVEVTSMTFLKHFRLAFNIEKHFEIVTVDKFQLDLRNRNGDIGNLMLM